MKDEPSADIRIYDKLKNRTHTQHGLVPGDQRFEHPYPDITEIIVPIMAVKDKETAMKIAADWAANHDV